MKNNFRHKIIWFGISLKLSIAIIILVSIILSTITVFIIYRESGLLKEQIFNFTKREITHLVNNAHETLGFDEHLLSESVNELKRNEYYEYVFVLGKNNEILYYFDRREEKINIKHKQRSALNDTIERTLEKKDDPDTIDIIDYKDQYSAGMIYDFSKIVYNKSNPKLKAGAVIIGITDLVIRNEMKEIKKLMIYIFLHFLAVSIIGAVILSKIFLKPVKKLTGATLEIEKGNFNYKIDKFPSDEFGILMRSFNKMIKGLSDRDKMKDAFSKFVNKEIAEQVLSGTVKLGGERKFAAIFFSDIRSFTSISEKLEPEEVVEFLNEYMTVMVDCVNATHGNVDKYIGDAIMAVWGAPVSFGNDTENAINCALLMRESLLEFNESRGGDKKPIIKICSGINSGSVLAGQIGSNEKMSYTVIGDTVNLASRIEALNKPFGTDILISDNSYQLVKDIYVVEKMPSITVKGKVNAQQVWAIIKRKDNPDRPNSLAELRVMLGIDIIDLSSFDPDQEHEEKFKIVG